MYIVLFLTITKDFPREWLQFGASGATPLSQHSTDIQRINSIYISIKRLSEFINRSVQYESRRLSINHLAIIQKQSTCVMEIKTVYNARALNREWKLIKNRQTNQYVRHVFAHSFSIGMYTHAHAALVIFPFPH